MKLFEFIEREQGNGFWVAGKTRYDAMKHYAKVQNTDPETVLRLHQVNEVAKKDWKGKTVVKNGNILFLSEVMELINEETMLTGETNYSWL